MQLAGQSITISFSDARDGSVVCLSVCLCKSASPSSCFSDVHFVCPCLPDLSVCLFDSLYAALYVFLSVCLKLLYVYLPVYVNLYAMSI